MKITLEEGLRRLANNPAIAAEFDEATRREKPGNSRREAVQSIITLIDATAAENSALKAKLAATKARVAAIENARKSQPASLMKPPITPTKATTSQATATAASFATQPLSMLRSEFQKLTPADKSRFSKQGGKLI